MSTDDPQYLDCALITGASSGLGWEFALQLAPLCKQLILVARRLDRLDELQAYLEEEFPHCSVTTIKTDLAQKSERLQLFQSLEDAQLKPSLLINNAGLGDYGEFATSQWEKVESMIEVNMHALTHLTHHFLPHMKESGSGAILNVSSLASTLPLPDFAVYAATKSYVTSLGEGLRAELAPYGIPVLSVCPGPIKTGFGEVAARSDEKPFKSSAYQHLYVPAEQVVSESLHSLFKNKPRCYPGWKVALAAFAITTAPIVAIRFFNSFRFRQSKAIDNE